MRDRVGSSGWPCVGHLAASTVELGDLGPEKPRLHGILKFLGWGNFAKKFLKNHPKDPSN